jgi:hypothetical protein
MASTIKLKNGTGVPLVGDLVQGEPAFDLTNKRLYTENAGGTVIEVGTNPSTLSVTGAATFNGNVAATRAVLGATDYATEQMSIFNSQAGAANNAATLGFHLSNLDWGSEATTARVSAVQENGITGATALVFGTATNGSETSAPERMRLDSSGNLSITTGKLNIATTVTPATASSAGTTGDIVWDASYIYVCTATNTWKRTAIATW